MRDPASARTGIVWRSVFKSKICIIEFFFYKHWWIFTSLVLPNRHRLRWVSWTDRACLRRPLIVPPCWKMGRPVPFAISAATYKLRPRLLARSYRSVLGSYLRFSDYPIRIFLPKICTHLRIENMSKID